MTEFGLLIKTKREERGLSLRKLSASCGISDSELMKIESGERKTPNYKTICCLASELGMHPVELLCAAGIMDESYVKPYRLIRNLEKLDGGELEIVQTLIDALIKKKTREKLSKEN